MRPSVRDALDRIEQILLDEDEETTHDVWDVLTALRGPDEDRYDKTTTTAVIRGAAFPRLAKRNSRERDGFSFAYPGGWEYRISNVVHFSMSPSRHFGSHIIRAARSLGLRMAGEAGEDE